MWAPATHETLPVLRGGGGGVLWAPAGPLLLLVEAEMGDCRGFFKPAHAAAHISNSMCQNLSLFSRNRLIMEHKLEVTSQSGYTSQEVRLYICDISALRSLDGVAIFIERNKYIYETVILPKLSEES